MTELAGHNYNYLIHLYDQLYHLHLNILQISYEFGQRDNAVEQQKQKTYVDNTANPYNNYRNQCQLSALFSIHSDCQQNLRKHIIEFCQLIGKIYDQINVHLNTLTDQSEDRNKILNEINQQPELIAIQNSNLRNFDIYDFKLFAILIDYDKNNRQYNLIPNSNIIIKIHKNGNWFNSQNNDDDQLNITKYFLNILEFTKSKINEIININQNKD